MLRRFSFSLLFIALVLSGCSSYDDSFVVTGSQPNTGTPSVVGRVVLERPIPGALISVTGPNGESLAPAGLQTDRNGLFFLYAALPPDSQVSASIPAATLGQGAAEPLTLKVRPSQPDRVVLNIPRHLASLLKDGEPGLSHEEAVARIEQLLQIPAPWQLDTVEESSLSPFHHGTFFQQAAQEGGVPALTGQLMQASAAGQTRTFTLGGALGEADSTSFGSIVGKVVDGGLGAVGGDIVGWGVRWLSQALFPSDPFSGISGQLNDLENQLQYYSQEYLQQQTMQNLTNQVANPTTVAASELSDAAAAFQPPSPPFALYALGTSSLAQILQGYEFATILEDLFSILTGNSGLGLVNPSNQQVTSRPERVLASLIYPICGIDSNLSDRYQGYGAFSFHTVTPVTMLHDYYLQIATMASNFLAENAHATVDTVSGSPLASLAQACRTAQLQFLGTSQIVPGVAARRQQVRQLTPLTLGSEQVFVDREYGLMWSSQAVGGLTYEQANSVAATLPVGGYTGWRLPYSFELDQLYTRIDAGWRNRTASQRQGKESSVLEDLGFDLSQMSSTHHVWTNGANVQDNVVSKYRYSLDTGSHDDAVVSGVHDVLFVRSYVETDANSYFSDGELMPVDNATLSVTAQAGANGVTQMKAAIDMHCPTGGPFTINGNSISPMYGNADFSLLNFPSFNVRPIPSSASGSSRPDSDVTSRVVWSSSNDTMAIVSNVTGEQGKVYWRYPAPSGQNTVTITATYGSYTASTTLQRPNGLEWQVDSIILTPDQAAVSFDGQTSQDIYFVATVFLLNSATGDRTAFRSSYVGGEQNSPPVTWSVKDDQGNDLSAPSGFADSQNSTLRLDVTSVGSTQYVTVTATSGTVSTSTKLYIDHN